MAEAYHPLWHSSHGTVEKGRKKKSWWFFCLHLPSALGAEWSAHKVAVWYAVYLTPGKTALGNMWHLFRSLLLLLHQALSNTSPEDEYSPPTALDWRVLHTQCCCSVECSVLIVVTQGNLCLWLLLPTLCITYWPFNSFRNHPIHTSHVHETPSKHTVVQGLTEQKKLEGISRSLLLQLPIQRESIKRRRLKISSAWVLDLWHGEKSVSAGLLEGNKYIFSYEEDVQDMRRHTFPAIISSLETQKVYE